MHEGDDCFYNKRPEDRVTVAAEVVEPTGCCAKKLQEGFNTVVPFAVRDGQMF